MEHDVAGRDESSESSAVHDVIVCYDSFNSLRRTDRRQIAPDFPIPMDCERFQNDLYFQNIQERTPHGPPSLAIIGPSPPL
jgi:hypothetical protein